MNKIKNGNISSEHLETIINEMPKQLWTEHVAEWLELLHQEHVDVHIKHLITNRCIVDFNCFAALLDATISSNN